MKTRIRVRVPATTSNIGPGFDTLGIALSLANEVELVPLTTPRVELIGNAASGKNHGAIAMVMGAARAFFRKVGAEERGFRARIRGHVPVARGLGSSVTVRLGVIAGLNHLFAKPLNKAEMLDLVSKLEGHPDNAAPAVYGGMAVAGMLEDHVICLHRKLPPKLKFVTVIPDYEVQTRQARAILPASLPFADAVHNLNRASLLVAAFWAGEWNKAAGLFEDRLHQPSRARLVPQLFPAIDAAREAGAIGGWLSGSGSSVMAVTCHGTEQVAKAMRKVFLKDKVACRVLVLQCDPRGVCCMENYED